MRLENHVIFQAAAAPAAAYAREFLEARGFCFTGEAKNAGHLLLDVPSFRENGLLRCGKSIESVLGLLPPNVRIWGGNLNHPALSSYHTSDLLQDPLYLAQNAWLTAECALDVTLPLYGGLLRGCPILVIGFGRIGKCLCRLFDSLGAEVTVAARKESDRAMAAAMGHRAVDYSGLNEDLPRFQILYNTVPALVLSAGDLRACHPRCLKIDLASKPGMEGQDVISARGLPGKHRPEASGRLIAGTMLRLMNKEDT